MPRSPASCTRGMPVWTAGKVLLWMSSPNPERSLTTNKGDPLLYWGFMDNPVNACVSYFFLVLYFDNPDAGGYMIAIFKVNLATKEPKKCL